MIRTVSVLLVATALISACETVPQSKWALRPGHDLGVDLAACAREAGGADMNALQGGATNAAATAAAVAGYLDRDDIRGGGADRLYAALRDDCMVRKGWTKIG